MAEKVKSVGNIKEIKLSDIIADAKFNARYDMSGDSTVDPKTGESVGVDTRAGIADFARAIEADGQQSPVRVWADGGKLKLVYGFRRFAAISELAKDKRKPANVSAPGFILAEVWEGSEKDAKIANLTENTQRNSLQTYELADRVKDLRDNYKISIDEIASHTGKSKGYLGNLMRVLERVHPDILTEWRKGKSGVVNNDLVVKWAGLEHAEQLKNFKRKKGEKVEREGGSGESNPRQVAGNPRASVKEMKEAIKAIRGSRVSQDVRTGMIAALRFAAGIDTELALPDGTLVYDPEATEEEKEEGDEFGYE